MNKRTQQKTTLKQMTLMAILVALIILLGLTPLGLIPLGFINVTILCVPVIIGTLYLDWKKGIGLGFGFGAVSFYSALVKPSALVSTLMAASPVLTAVMTFIPRLCIPLVAWVVYRYMTKSPDTQTGRKASIIFGTLATTLIGLLVFIILYISKVIKIPSSGESATIILSRNNMLLLIGGAVLLFAVLGFAEALFLTGRGFQQVIVRHASAAVAAVAGSMTNTVLYLGMMLLFYIFCGIDTQPVLALIGGTALIAGLSEATVAAVLVPPILSAVQKIKVQ